MWPTRIAEEVERLMVRMAEENRTWGYRRIQGAWSNLGHPMDAIPVRNILRRHHLEPVPQRRNAGRGGQRFLQIHWDVLAATDFCTVEVATWQGRATSDVLVVMELCTRRVPVAGITPHPTDAFRQQCARRLTDPVEGFLLDTRYLLHDRDEKFVHGFDRTLRASRVEPSVLPARSPNLNAYGERFVRSITQEALNQMIVIGEATLRCIIRSYLAHDHHERKHQGLGTQLMVPGSGMEKQRGLVVRRDHLGGLLSYDHREAA